LSYLRLILIRHAQSIGNTQARMEGQQSTPLSTCGEQQAQQLAHALVKANHAPDNRQLAVNCSLSPLLLSHLLPSHLYSSPLVRAHQTATVLSQALEQAGHSVSLILNESLQEIHPGIFQGLTWQEATIKYPRLCSDLMTSLAWQPVPNAESPVAARARAQQWIDQLLVRHQPGDTIWAVSHAGLMIQLISTILGCDRTWKLTIHHTAIFEFWLADTHWQTLTQDRFNPEYWILRRFNDASHLI